jgi:hypothetical protein
MCQDYGNRIPSDAYLETFSHLKVRIFSPGGRPIWSPKMTIWPTDTAPIIRLARTAPNSCWGFRRQVALPPSKANYRIEEPSNRRRWTFFSNGHARGSLSGFDSAGYRATFSSAARAQRTGRRVTHETGERFVSSAIELGLHPARPERATT